MSRVHGYGNGYYENTVGQNPRHGRAKETQKAEQAAKSGRAEKDGLQLSEKAKSLLEELKKKYGNMDFMVANYRNSREASEYLSRGTKEYSVLIEPEVLEEMAADEDTKSKYLGLLDEATTKLADIKEELGDKETEVVRTGVTIGKDGKMSYFAELENMSEKQKERIEKASIEKAREHKQEDKIARRKTKKTSVQADSVEELLKKIKNVRWDKVKGQDAEGAKFDSKA